MDDEQRRSLEIELLENPRKGRVIPGTGGVRKIRVGMRGRGKRGGARVIYFFAGQRERIYMIVAYAKSEQENLTPEDKAVMRKLVEELEWEHRED